MRLHGIGGDVMELSIEAEVPRFTRFGVKLRMSPDGEEQTAVIVDAARQTLSIDTTCSSTSDQIFQRYPIAIGGVEQQDVRIQCAPFELGPDEPLHLRIFLDRSILEVYANRRQCVTQRIYPARPDSLGVALFSERGGSRVRRVEAWEIEPANGVEG